MKVCRCECVEFRFGGPACNALVSGWAPGLRSRIPAGRF